MVYFMNWIFTFQFLSCIKCFSGYLEHPGSIRKLLNYKGSETVWEKSSLPRSVQTLIHIPVSESAGHKKTNFSRHGYSKTNYLTVDASQIASDSQQASIPSNRRISYRKKRFSNNSNRIWPHIDVEPMSARSRQDLSGRMKILQNLKKMTKLKDSTTTSKVQSLRKTSLAPREISTITTSTLKPVKQNLPPLELPSDGNFLSLMKSLKSATFRSKEDSILDSRSATANDRHVHRDEAYSLILKQRPPYEDVNPRIVKELKSLEKEFSTTSRSVSVPNRNISKVSDETKVKNPSLEPRNFDDPTGDNNFEHTTLDGSSLKLSNSFADSETISEPMIPKASIVSEKNEAVPEYPSNRNKKEITQKNPDVLEFANEDYQVELLKTTTTSTLISLPSHSSTLASSSKNNSADIGSSSKQGYLSTKSTKGSFSTPSFTTQSILLSNNSKTGSTSLENNSIVKLIKLDKDSVEDKGVIWQDKTSSPDTREETTPYGNWDSPNDIFKDLTKVPPGSKLILPGKELYRKHCLIIIFFLL